MFDCTVVQSLPAATRLGYGWRQKQDKTRQQQNNLAELEASLAPAEAEVGAMAKADQNRFACLVFKTKDGYISVWTVFKT